MTERSGSPVLAPVIPQVVACNERAAQRAISGRHREQSLLISEGGKPAWEYQAEASRVNGNALKKEAEKKIKRVCHKSETHQDQ